MIKHRQLRRRRKRKAALPVLLEARPHSVKATARALEGQDENLYGHLLALDSK
jgi:hypothetical protein